MFPTVVIQAGASVPERDEDPREEQQRQDRGVHDRRRGVGVRDHGGERERQRRERERADDQRDHELHSGPPVGSVRAVDEPAERRT